MSIHSSPWMKRDPKVKRRMRYSYKICKGDQILPYMQRKSCFSSSRTYKTEVKTHGISSYDIKLTSTIQKWVKIRNFYYNQLKIEIKTYHLSLLPNGTILPLYFKQSVREIWWTVFNFVKCRCFLYPSPSI